MFFVLFFLIFVILVLPRHHRPFPLRSPRPYPVQILSCHFLAYSSSSHFMFHKIAPTARVSIGYSCLLPSVSTTLSRVSCPNSPSLLPPPSRSSMTTARRLVFALLRLSRCFSTCSHTSLHVLQSCNTGPNIRKFSVNEHLRFLECSSRVARWRWTRTANKH